MMLLRAVVISLLFHLLLLLSSDSSWHGSGVQSGEKWPLRTTLRDPAPSLGGWHALPASRTSAQTPAEGRRASERLRTPSVKNDHFLPPAVAFAKPGGRVEMRESDHDGAEPLQASGEGERAYRLNLAREARRYKSYPSSSDGSKAEGVAFVSVSPLAGPGWPEVRLHRSSGDEGLDRSAIEIIAMAARSASIPVELQGRRFLVVVPVEYRHDD